MEAILLFMPIVHDPKAKQKIDAAFSAMPTWARAMCTKLRRLIHTADPDIIEDWKWGPSFHHQGPVCNVWAFKGWVSIVFFQGARMRDRKKLFNAGFDNANSRTIKFTDITQIKEAEIVAYVREAVRLNAAGPVRRQRASRPQPRMLGDVKQLLVRHHLLAAYHDRPPYQRRDYLNWVLAAKQDRTRTQRLATMIEDLQSGRYMKMAWASLHRRRSSS